MKNVVFLQTSVGRLGIAAQDQKITDIFFDQGDEIPKGMENQATPLLEEASCQLKEYFAGERRNFDLPLAPEGTAFQQSVWQALLAIPYGETRTYKQIAELVNNPKASRAVGMANHQNPIPIVIPCHRVIGAGGRLTGYGGGLDVKQALLELEGVRPDS